MDEITDLYTELETFQLDNRFSLPIWDYYYNSKSLLKYWLLTRDLVSEKIYVNSDFFKHDEWVDLRDIPAEHLGEALNAPGIDSAEVDHDFITIPQIQRNHTICTALTLVEKFLMDICLEFNENFLLNGKGSYIQQYNYFIKNSSSIEIEKSHLKSFEAYGHIRNSFMHQFDTYTLSIPLPSVKHINQLCGKFTRIEDGVSNIHVDIILKILCEFGGEFQSSYYQNLEQSSE